MATNKPIVRGRLINKGDEDNSLSSGNLNNLDEQNKVMIRSHLDLYNKNPNAWIQKYGGTNPERAESLLLELSSDMNYQSEHEAVQGEEEIGAIIADRVEDEVLGADPTLHGNKLQRFGKGGVRGSAIMWNTFIDAGREAADFENWAKMLDGMYNMVHSDENHTRKLETYAENVKRKALKYGVGGYGRGNPLMELWGKTVASEYDYRNLLDRMPKDMQGDTSWFKVDIPWEEQNLGTAGRFGEILAMEAMTMGPLAAMKLARASHVINYFKKAAGGDGVKLVEAGKRAFSKLSKAELEAVDASRKYTPIKAVTRKEGKDIKTSLEILDRNNIGDLADKGTFIWRPIKTRFFTKPKQTKEAYSKLLDLASADGRWIDVVPFLGRKGFTGAKKLGGSYREAEIYASLAAGAGGAWMYDLTNGSEWSILGEVAGGVMGARVLNATLRTGHDIFNSLRFNMPHLTPEARADAVMRSFGFDRAGKDMVLSEIKDIGPKGAGIHVRQGEYFDPISMTVIDEARKNRLVDLARSFPSPIPKILGGQENAKNRAFLKSLRSMHEMIESLPHQERQDFKNRLMLMDKLFSKFANVAGGGRLFTALSKALSMDVLNTVRKKTIGADTLGHRVKIKINPTARALAARELEMTESLIDVMMHFGDEAWDTVGLQDLIIGFKRAADQSMSRVKDDIGEGGMVQAFKESQQQKLDYLTKMETKRSLSSEKININRFQHEDGTIQIRTKEELKNLQEQGVDVKKGLMDFESDTVLKKGDDVVDEYMNNHGAHFWYDEKTGENVYINIADSFSDADVKYVTTHAPRLVNRAFSVARGRADREYKKIRNYKEKFNSKINKTAAQQVADAKASHEIVDTLGQELMAVKAQMGEDIIESSKLGAFSKRIEDFDSLESFLEGKRAELITKQFKAGRLSEEKLAETWQKLAESRGFDRKSVAADPANNLDALSVNDQIQDIANNLDVSLRELGEGYDFSLETMTTMRTDLKQLAFKNIQTTDSVLHKSSHMQLQGAEAITKAFDEAEKVADATSLNDWKMANKFFKDNVADPFYRGVGYQLISRTSRGDKKIGPLAMFDQFIGKGSKDADWERNATMFKKMFDVEGVRQEVIDNFSQKSRDLLKKMLKLRALDKVEVPRGFHQAFGGEDLLDYRKALDGSESLPKGTSMDEIGRILSGGDDDATRALNDEISPWKKKVEQLIKKEEGRIARGRADTIIKDDFNIEGLTFNDVNSIFGRIDAGEKEVRQMIIDGTYKGGNTRQADKVYNILEKRLDEATKIGDTVSIEKYERGIHSLQRILYDGAMEEAQLAGKKAEGIRIKHDPTDKFGDISGSSFETVLNLDASAFNLYVSRNRKLLSKILSKQKLSDGATMWDKLNDMNSLITIVAGEVPTATMEGLPKHFRVEQIISRIYSIARGVVSPRYVLTELLIQDWRFRRGTLIKELATDQDASKLLYDVIFTDGLKNPRLRSEFVSKWLNTLIRYNRGNESGDHTNFNNDAGESQHITQTKERVGKVVEEVGDATSWAIGKIPGVN